MTNNWNRQESRSRYERDHFDDVDTLANPREPGRQAVKRGLAAIALTGSLVAWGQAQENHVEDMDNRADQAYAEKVAEFKEQNPDIPESLIGEYLNIENQKSVEELKNQLDDEVSIDEAHKIGLSPDGEVVEVEPTEAKP